VTPASRPGPAGSPPDPYATLQVHPSACPEVIEAAFRVLRELTCRDDGDDAPRRLAELNAAHRALREARR
jgi:hypothetical protein